MTMMMSRIVAALRFIDPAMQPHINVRSVSLIIQCHGTSRETKRDLEKYMRIVLRL